VDELEVHLWCRLKTVMAFFENVTLFTDTIDFFADIGVGTVINNNFSDSF
jgi:hypothetical protein